MSISPRSGGAVLGLDVGYGNLKIVGGLTGSQDVREFVLPAGAAPISSMPRRSDNTCDLKGGEQVLIDGCSWAAGVEQVHIQNRARMTHDEYPRTPEYKALFLAALARMGYRRIDFLVTGLPVSQIYGPGGQELIADMQAMMRGQHLINADMTVDVGAVQVIPQPLGTFFGLAAEKEYASLATSENLQTLIFDPGYFSVDFVVMSGRAVMNQFSGTSLQATSMILERAAHALSTKHGRAFSSDQLDAAQRSGAPTITAGFGREIEYLPALVDAAKELTPSVIGDLKRTIRTARPLDLVIMTGGGAWLYEDAIRAAYPGVEIASVPDKVLGNARGYRVIAEMQAERLGRRAA